MRELQADVSTLTGVICVTTNGEIRGDGTAVMGKGNARYWRDRYPQVAYNLANHLRRGHNTPTVIYQSVEDNITLVSFPTKHLWRQRADLDLIINSAKRLVVLADLADWKTVYLPRPGCGPATGQLDWSAVREILAPILDDRFVIVDNSML